jgi:hypothetical protein
MRDSCFGGSEAVGQPRKRHGDVQRCRAAKPSPLPALCHARCSAFARGVPSMEQSKKIVAPQQFAIA